MRHEIVVLTVLYRTAVLQMTLFTPNKSPKHVFEAFDISVTQFLKSFWGVEDFFFRKKSRCWPRCFPHHYFFRPKRDGEFSRKKSESTSLRQFWGVVKRGVISSFSVLWRHVWRYRKKMLIKIRAFFAYQKRFERQLKVLNGFPTKKVPEQIMKPMGRIFSDLLLS